MHQEHSDHLPKHDFSPTSSYSASTMAHHQSLSTDSFSPIMYSTASFSTDDTYQTSSPVKETDEIVIRTYYAGDPVRAGYDDQDGTSLWHDLDRDGVNTPAIPSFILNSPPMGPMMNETEYPEISLHQEHRAPSEVAIHSLRKGNPHIKLAVDHRS